MTLLRNFIGGTTAALVLVTAFVTVLLTGAEPAEAKVNPTISAQQCLVRDLAKGGDAKHCFTDDGWKGFGADFTGQQKRKGWKVVAGDSGSCCTAPVLWAEVTLEKAGRVVDTVYLIFAKTGGKPKLKIAELTEKHPEPPKRK